MAKEVFTAPWYPWYVKDAALSDRIDDMTLAEEGAYRRALDYQWMHGSVPSDPQILAKRIRKGCTVKIAQTVLTMFDKMRNHPDKKANQKLEKVRQEQLEKHLKNVKKGKQGALNRWKDKASGDSTAIAEPMPKQWHSESEEEQKKNKKRTTTTAAAKICDDDWLDDLQKNPAYERVNVRVEFARAQVWAETNRRQCTRRFFVGWLNRAKPMDVKGQPNGNRKSEREKSAERGSNAIALIAELRRQGEIEEQTLSRGNGGTGPPNALALKPAEFD